jgi:hypothetical protein
MATPSAALPPKEMAVLLSAMATEKREPCSFTSRELTTDHTCRPPASAARGSESARAGTGMAVMATERGAFARTLVLTVFWLPIRNLSIPPAIPPAARQHTSGLSPSMACPSRSTDLQRSANR